MKHNISFVKVPKNKYKLFSKRWEKRQQLIIDCIMFNDLIKRYKKEVASGI
jgi:hypothetical protein